MAVSDGLYIPEERIHLHTEDAELELLAIFQIIWLSKNPSNGVDD